MELDFKAVKALSSPTRIRILNCLLEKEATPTEISRSVGKSNSTVSNHLDKLIGADLLEKDERDGRKRVVYSPTKKAEAIVKGKEKKVRFSLGSSAVSLLGAIGLGSYGAFEKIQTSSNRAQSLSSIDANTGVESSNYLAETASGSSLTGFSRIMCVLIKI